jgi:beta-RFAP synthase
LAQWLNLPWRDAKLLCAMSGRGRRSAIGTHGFLQGGLLVDAGKLPGETLGQLADRIEVPTQWRFILIRQPSARGLAGSQETQTMRRLPPVPDRVTAELERLIHEEILPAAKTANCQEFSEAIYRYGHLAGECFALAQGGPFATPDIAALIGDLQQLGVAGVGQSSWGPTVFAITANAAAAQQLVSHLQADRRHQHRHFTIASPNNSGVCAQVTAE